MSADRSQVFHVALFVDDRSQENITLNMGDPGHLGIPRYPQMARIAHIQGDVLLTTIIDKQGDVKNLRAVSGHPILIQAALDAERQWKYKPYLLNGEPVEIETTITIKFHM